LNGVAQTASGSASPISLGNAAGIYTVTGVTDVGCSNTGSGTQTIVVNSIPDAPTAGNDSTYCSAWTLIPMTATGTGGTMTWYSSTGSVLGTGSSFAPNSTEGTTLYYVTETVLGCEGVSSEVMITINVCDITTPTAFTPDGDGVNETWQIVDLDIVYPDNVVRIYNRWGNLIYEHDSSADGPYSSNEWDGTYKGEALPVGSYYFAIEFNNDEKESTTGTVSILKK
jgi:gliding motility-associated-like protein